jgi:hypothetical protein
MFYSGPLQNVAPQAVSEPEPPASPQHHDTEELSDIQVMIKSLPHALQLVRIIIIHKHYC